MDRDKLADFLAIVFAAIVGLVVLWMLRPEYIRTWLDLIGF
jgi:hypothetical protein